VLFVDVVLAGVFAGVLAVVVLAVVVALAAVVRPVAGFAAVLPRPAVAALGAA